MAPTIQTLAFTVEAVVQRDAPTASPASNSNNGLAGSLGGGNVDLVAMVVSDSGLADEEPKWCTAAPLGCLLIGLQPRGGWQIMQRSVQWGSDRWARAFGVQCSAPLVYSYFACSMRNRIEVWSSPHFWSPMQGVAEAGHWQSAPTFNVKRPTKLIDGSRGGQAFICDLLRPADDKHYSIKQQSHFQLLSVMLVAAGLMDDVAHDQLEHVMAQDFGITPHLSHVFRRLLLGLAVANVFTLGFILTVMDALWRGDHFYGAGLPYAIKLSSIVVWQVGAIGLLMLGGNPRVRITTGPIAQHVEDRLAAAAVAQTSSPTESKGKPQDSYTAPQIQALEVPSKLSPEPTPPRMCIPAMEPLTAPAITVDKTLDETQVVKLRFGSLHGSVYTPDQGSCELPLAVVRRICSWDIELQRSFWWYAGIFWFGVQLLLSIAVQVAGSRSSTIRTEAMSITILLVTSIARGSGVSGPEDWMIPRWKRRADTNAGALLLGKMTSRK